MLPFEDRFTRQRQLVEVGHAGQERIARWHAVLTQDESSAVEELYLRRAGVLSFQQQPAAQAPVVDYEFTHESARRFGVGARRAHNQLCAALGLPGEGSRRAVSFPSPTQPPEG